jgi:predicted DCC family thiol-disulfide oxidoreductase YuxK
MDEPGMEVWMNGQPAVTVYYDGACPVCSREIGVYRRADRGGCLSWHDVSVDAGDLAKDGVTQGDALRRIHARLPDGSLVTGVDAFIALWRRLPGFRCLAVVAAIRPVRWLLGKSYDWYAARRMRFTGRQLPI